MGQCAKRIMAHVSNSCFFQVEVSRWYSRHFVLRFSLFFSLFFWHDAFESTPVFIYLLTPQLAFSKLSSLQRKRESEGEVQKLVVRSARSVGALSLAQQESCCCSSSRRPPGGILRCNAFPKNPSQKFKVMVRNVDQQMRLSSHFNGVLNAVTQMNNPNGGRNMSHAVVCVMSLANDLFCCRFSQTHAIGGSLGRISFNLKEQCSEF